MLGGAIAAAVEVVGAADMTEDFRLSGNVLKVYRSEIDSVRLLQMMYAWVTRP